MRITEKFGIFKAYDVISGKTDALYDIKYAFNNCDLRFGKDRPKEIKEVIESHFNRLGWADRVPIAIRQNLTVSFIKNQVGVCIQFGNVARTHSDILKLAYIAQKHVIEIGVIIVPNASESKLLGANYASFDKLAREVEIYSEIINSPMLVIGVSN